MVGIEFGSSGSGSNRLKADKGISAVSSSGFRGSELMHVRCCGPCVWFAGGNQPF